MPKIFYKEDNELIPAIEFSDVQPIDFSPVIDESEYKSLIKMQYKCREKDGKEYFEEVRSDLVYSYTIEETITAEDVFFIETALEPVLLKLERGDWMTASYLMTNNVVVQSSLTQELYDEILNYINLYIQNNY